MGELNVGTLSSSVSTGVILRLGTNLADSYATTLYSNTRTSNPISVKKGHWNTYIGFIAKYVFNEIFADGNTFKNSHSLDYEREQIKSIVGLSYSWGNYSFAFAINNSNIINNKSTEQLERYGTLTFAIKL